MQLGITTHEARLLLLAAVSMLRAGDIDGYAYARLAQYGYTPAQAQIAVRCLLSALPLAAAAKATRTRDDDGVSF